MVLSEDTLQAAAEAGRLRRSLHRIPEKGLREYKTQRFVLDYLRDLGLDARSIAGTGVKAVIAGGLPGPVTALRADMDALNVEEKTACGFESEHPGWMHACGHDGHMAALLTAAGLFARNRERVRGTVVLLFQPCEEDVAGARLMIGEGALADPAVDRIFALHMMPGIEEGRLGVAAGPLMASACEFEIVVRGRSAHGAMPHIAVDAIAASAAFVTGAQAVISRAKPPEAPGLLTFGRFEGGKRHNIIADRVELEGTLRCYDDALMLRLKDRLLAHLGGVEQAWGVTAEFREIQFVPVTANDADLTELTRSLCSDACVEVAPTMVAEDFSRYCQAVPGFMGLVGCRNEAKGFTAPLHSAAFNFDESALNIAVEFYKRLITG
jgi:amidohydrolase